MTDETMSFPKPPRFAAWQHAGARRGFEVVFLRTTGGELRAEGTTTAVEGDDGWAVEYAIGLDPGWRTVSAEIAGRSAAGAREVAVRNDGGRWRVDNRLLPELDGCMDVDLESSVLTNAFPVHRLGLAVGQEAEAPAAYVRAVDLAVERLEQQYLRLPDVSGRQRYRYRAPRFDFECELVYDESGLLVDYPGIATRVAGSR
jgi:hypothetical protein